MKLFKGWSLIEVMKVNPEAVYRLIEMKKSSFYHPKILLIHFSAPFTYPITYFFILSNSYSMQHQDSRHKNGIYQQRIQLAQCASALFVQILLCLQWGVRLNPTPAPRF